MSLRTSTWVRLYGDSFTNKKIAAAATSLTRGDVHKMVGHLGALWTWAMEFAQDGDLGHVNDRAIAQGAGWPKGPRRFVEALLEAGLLDEDRRLHDWYSYAGRLIEQRQRDAERKRADYAKKTGASPSDSPMETPSGSPMDIRRQTSPDQPREKAGSSLRSNLEDRLAAAFTKIGCEDNALADRLRADEAIEVIVEKLENLAEKPGQPGASPTSRITKYLKACEDSLEEERERVRHSRAPERTSDEVRHGYLPSGESCGRDDCSICA